MTDENKSKEQFIKQHILEEKNNIYQTCKELKLTYDEFQQIFNTSTNGTCIVDNDFNLVKANKTMVDLFNKDLKTIVGQKCFDVFCLNKCGTCECSLNRILNDDESCKHEELIECNDELNSFFLSTARPFRNDKGEIIGIIKDFRNITKLKHSEESLRKSEAKFKSYVNLAPDGIFIVDEKGKYRDVNPAGCQMLGYTRDELLQMKIEDITASKSLRHFNRLLETGISDGEVVDYRKDGTKIINENCAIALDGGLYIGYKRDVTIRKKVEEALRKSEKKYHLLLNGISDIVVLCKVKRGLRFRVTKTNKAFLLAIGLAEEQVLKKNIQDILPDNIIIDKWLGVAKKVIESGREISYEEYFNNEYYDIKIIPIVNSGGNCTHVITVARNISDQKMIEDYRLRMEKMESISLLAGGIAHDFNNILTVAMGSLSLAKMKLKSSQKGNDAKILNLLAEAEESFLQSKRLTQQLLTFAKGGAPIIKTSSIKELLEESVTFSIRGSNTYCQYSIPGDLFPVEIDEGQIGQVINNIVINASQAMPKGGTVEISAKNLMLEGDTFLSLDDGRYVKISISDHGSGIPEEHLSKIFDPYFTTKEKGSGLGLATSYSIVNKHGGCITVESQIDAGTTFNIYLKASIKKEYVKEKIQKAKALLKGSGRILVMDDNEMIREFLKQALNSLGYEAVCAKDGREAVALFKYSESAFDAVILDLTVPGGMGGKEAIKEIKKINSNIKAIVSSGYNDDSILDNYKKHGFDGFVAKPYSIEELREALKKLSME